MSFFEFFELIFEIVIDVFKKFFGAFFACEFLPFFEEEVMVGLDSAILLSDLKETFFVLLELLIVFKELLIDIHFVFDVSFLLLESVFFDKIPFSFDGIVLIIKFEVFNFCGVDHACEFIFHFSVLVVGADGMSNDWILVFV